MKVKDAIVKLKKHTSIREIAKTLGVSRSMVGYILKKKASTGELNNIKRPGRPRKTIKGDDCRIFYLVKKKNFITSTEIKNTLEKVGTSLSKSTIKRRLHECKHRGFTTRCKPLVTFKNRKARLDFARSKKSLPCSGIRFFGLMKPRSTCTKLMGREKYGEKKKRNSSRSKAHHIKCQTWWRQCYGMGMYGCQWNGLTAVY